MPAPRRNVLKPPARRIRRGSRLLRPAATTLVTPTRQFASTDSVTLGVGGLASAGTSALTYLAIVKRTTSADQLIVGFKDSGGTLQSGLVINGAGDSNQVGLQGNAGGALVAVSFPTTDGWVLVGITKATGASTPRGHKYLYSTTSWTHTDAGVTVGNQASISGGSVRLGASGASSYNNAFTGNLGVVGVWVGTALTDLQVETLELDLQSWVNLSPTALWRLDQSTTATSITDITGGGADQSALSGTAVVLDSPSGFDWTLGGGGHTVTAGQATETEAAQPVGRLKTRAAAQPVEAEAAQPVTAAKAKAAGQAIEAEAAQPISRVKTRTVGQAVETEVGQPITKTGPKIITVGQAVETETPQSAAASKTRAVAQAVETEQAQPATSRKTKAAAQAIEGETAQPATRVKSRALGQPVETEAAQPASHRKTATVGQVIEAEAAQTISRPGHIILTLGQALEAEAAQAVARSKLRVVGQAVEAEVAQVLVRLKVNSFGQVIESEAALEIVVVGGLPTGLPGYGVATISTPGGRSHVNAAAGTARVSAMGGTGHVEIVG